MADFSKSFSSVGQKPPCSNVASTLYTTLILCIVPILASIYCIMQLIYRGIMSAKKIFDFSDMEQNYKSTCVLIFAAIWFVILSIIVPFMNYLIYGEFNSSILFK